MTAHHQGWPVAVATHAARDVIGSAPGSGFERFLDWAVAAGFDGIDLSNSVLYDDYAAESMERIRWSIRAAAALEAPVVSLSLALPQQVDDCNQFRGLNHSMGCSRGASDQTFEATALRLRDLAAEARNMGVALSIETHHASLADTGAATLKLWQMVDDDSVGLNPDLVNVLWAYATPEEDWRETLRLLAPHANLWHVKNVRRVELEPGQRAAYIGTSLGEGDIDHRWAVAGMRQAGFAGWVSIERGGGGDALAELRAGLAYLRSDLFRDDEFKRES